LVRVRLLGMSLPTYLGAVKHSEGQSRDGTCGWVESACVCAFTHPLAKMVRGGTSSRPRLRPALLGLPWPPVHVQTRAKVDENEQWCAFPWCAAGEGARGGIAGGGGAQRGFLLSSAPWWAARVLVLPAPTTPLCHQPPCHASLTITVLLRRNYAPVGCCLWQGWVPGGFLFFGRQGVGFVSSYLFAKLTMPTLAQGALYLFTHTLSGLGVNVL
jgi:hypothetical protein